MEKSPAEEGNGLCDGESASKSLSLTNTRPDTPTSTTKDSDEADLKSSNLTADNTSSPTTAASLNSTPPPTAAASSSPIITTTSNGTPPSTPPSSTIPAVTENPDSASLVTPMDATTTTPEKTTETSSKLSDKKISDDYVSEKISSSSSSSARAALPVDRQPPFPLAVKADSAKIPVTLPKSSLSSSSSCDPPPEKRLKLEAGLVEAKMAHIGSSPKKERNTSLSASQDGVQNLSMKIEAKMRQREPILSMKLKDGEREASAIKREDDASPVKSEDSEKENLGMDMPVDLSTKPASSSPDIITLSDDSDDEKKTLNGAKELTADEKRMRKKLVKTLQAELRNEEAKLVLLKKLRQSQLSHQLQEQSNVVANNKQLSNRQQQQQQQQQSAPPPLVRGNNQPLQSSKSNSSSTHSQFIRGSQQMAAAQMRAQQMHHQQQQHQQHQQQQQQQQQQGPPPLVMAPRGMPHGMQNMRTNHNQMSNSNNNLMSGFRPIHTPPTQTQPPPAPPPAQPVETAAQRQAAAKLALRKQLEKTLLQIPPPKPPPPEMNFIPSLASNEFIMLLGLEEVVNYIVDSDLIARGEKNLDHKMICNPFSCVQCNTDFTPVWKREKPGSKNVICEQCVTSNQKKALKQEHTNRLKSAFVKALQQEQEIERMQSQGMNMPTTVANNMNMGTTAPMNLTNSYNKPNTDHFRHHQTLMHAHQLQRPNQPIGLQPFTPRGPFHYQLPFTKPDLHRQYLLDLIPPRPRGAMPWKS